MGYDKAPDLYSGGTWFESLLEHLRDLFVILRIPSRQIPGIVSQLDRLCSLVVRVTEVAGSIPGATRLPEN
jgi:hypothetical protein